MEARQRPFDVATYNVLAACYVHRARYPRVPTIILDNAWRVPALVQHIANLKADILCLQEVEPETLAALRSRLTSSGARYARKTGGPEGCATFYRLDLCQIEDERVLRFTDGRGAETATGNLALVTIFRLEGRRLGVINTHLTWDPPGSQREQRRGLRQVQQLVREYGKIAGNADAWIVSGDLNVPPDSDSVSLIRDLGFRCTHADQQAANTCSFGGKAEKIDYLLHSSNLQSRPYEVCPIDHQTILPSAEQPSDHVAVRARFEFLS
jgi:endonuclease/exonuclease/phosphatase family metal-dependent hydrolase